MDAPARFIELLDQPFDTLANIVPAAFKKEVGIGLEELYVVLKYPVAVAKFARILRNRTVGGVIRRNAEQGLACYVEHRLTIRLSEKIGLVPRKSTCAALRIIEGVANAKLDYEFDRLGLVQLPPAIGKSFLHRDR